jgi:hypothetical protein
MSHTKKQTVELVVACLATNIMFEIKYNFGKTQNGPTPHEHVT